jgi:TRAP-type C4-dicarboxylate transport system permease small subunit
MGMAHGESELSLLDRLARLCAVLACVLLTTIALLTCVSLVGRNAFGWALAGDFELAGAAAGAAIALFMPWCQLRRGHISVGFFTAHASAATQAWLDRLGALLLALVFALLAWRTGVGGVGAWRSGAGSMLLGLPEWTVYVAMLPPLLLTALIGLTQALRGAAFVDGA